MHVVTNSWHTLLLQSSEIWNSYNFMSWPYNPIFVWCFFNRFKTSPGINCRVAQISCNILCIEQSETGFFSATNTKIAGDRKLIKTFGLPLAHLHIMTGRWYITVDARRIIKSIAYYYLFIVRTHTAHHFCQWISHHRTHLQCVRSASILRFSFILWIRIFFFTCALTLFFCFKQQQKKTVEVEVNAN